MATGRKRKLSITKVASRKKKKSPGPSSAAAIPQTDDLANLPSSSSEGNFLDSLYACNHIDTNHTIHSDYQHIPKDLGMISEFIHKSILHITNNYLSACRSCIDWIIWLAEHHNSGFYNSAFCSCWLQFWWHKLEASKHPSSQPISQHLLLSSAILTPVLFLGARISRQ